MLVDPSDIPPFAASERSDAAWRSRRQVPLLDADIAIVEGCIASLRRMTAEAAGPAWTRDPPAVCTGLADAHAAVKACVARLATLL